MTHSLPQILLLQLPRSEYVDGRLQIRTNAINVTYEIQFDILDGFRFHLEGAIVYQQDEDALTRQDEHGHYICYLKENYTTRNEKGEIWKKVNDESVTLFTVVDNGTNSKKDSHLHPHPQDRSVISRKALCSLLGGKTRGCKYFATLLMYKLVEIENY